MVEYWACRSELNCQLFCWQYPRKSCLVSVSFIEMTGSSSCTGVGCGVRGVGRWEGGMVG